MQGNVSDALAEYRAYVSIAKPLAVQNPTNADRQRDLAVGHVKLGEVLFSNGDVSDALEEYPAYLAIVEMLAAKDPTNANPIRPTLIRTAVAARPRAH